MATCGCDLAFPLHDKADVARVTDAGAPDDGGIDGPFCLASSTHLLCADFDHGDLSAGWNGPPFQTGPVSIGLDPDHVSPPYSLLTTAKPGSDREEVDLFQTFTGTFSHLKVEFWVHVDTLAGGQVVIATLGNDAYSLDLALRDTPYIEEYSPAFKSFGWSAPFTVGRWTKLTMDISFEHGALQISQDGSPALAVSLNAPSTITDPKLDLGIVFAPLPSPGWSVRFDNVTVDP